MDRFVGQPGISSSGLACGKECKFGMRKGVLDEFFELEVAVCQGECALGGTVKILSTVARKVDPMALGHFIDDTLDGAIPILQSDEID